MHFTYLSTYRHVCTKKLVQQVFLHGPHTSKRFVFLHLPVAIWSRCLWPHLSRLWFLLHQEQLKIKKGHQPVFSSHTKFRWITISCYWVLTSHTKPFEWRHASPSGKSTGSVTWKWMWIVFPFHSSACKHSERFVFNIQIIVFSSAFTNGNASAMNANERCSQSVVLSCSTALYRFVFFFWLIVNWPRQKNFYTTNCISLQCKGIYFFEWYLFSKIVTISNSLF